MSREKDEAKLKRWFSRVGDANKAYNRWEKDYKVARCKRYWRGFQRVGDDQFDRKGNERIQVNLIQPTIGIKIPSLYFYYPYARISGAPGEVGTPSETIDDRARLLEDTANTIIREPSCGFRWETLLALKDTMWAFGVVEIGYSADFVDNPSFERPPLYETEDAKEDIGKAPEPEEDNKSDEMSFDPALKSLRKIVQKETFFVRRIPPETFRCSINGKPTLFQNDWVGYYEWMYVEDVKSAPAFKGKTKGLKPSGRLSGDYSGGMSVAATSFMTGHGPQTSEQFANEDTYETRDRSGQVQVWKIWSLREKMRYVFAEGHDQFLLKEQYKTLPLFVLRFEELPDDFYPIPPIFPMLQPQDEYNDGREMLRGIRKTIYPRYLVKDGVIEPTEVAKLEEGGPNTYAWTQDTAAIQPVQQIAYDAAVIRTLSVAKDDLMQVSGISGEQRGQAESDTATQAEIINQRSLVRESFGRLRVAEWLGNIISGLLHLAIEKMTLPMVVLKNVDPFSPMLIQEALRVEASWRQITFQELKEADNLVRWDVNVNIETLSPLTEQTARAELGQLLQMIGNPAVAMLLSRSKALLKRTLDTFGFRSAADQQDVMEALGMVSQAVQQGAIGGMPSPPAAPNSPFPQPPGPGGPTPNSPTVTPQPPQAVMPPGGPGAQALPSPIGPR
jgi:hypothetical protein